MIYFIECFESLHGNKFGFIAQDLDQVKTLIPNCWDLELPKGKILSQ
jgi:DNA-binding transcriptional regulator PaaX